MHFGNSNTWVFHVGIAGLAISIVFPSIFLIALILPHSISIFYRTML
ncbi:hypothetical protein C5167_011808 [Papaver somniferum]|nr:hypothetical protein C5167_011808 [Papaver somniferum]